MLGVESSNTPISGTFAYQFAQQLHNAIEVRKQGHDKTKLTEQILINNGYKRVTDGSFPFDGTMLTYENDEKIMFIYDPSCQGKDEWWCCFDGCILEDDFVDTYVENFNHYLASFKFHTLTV